MIAEVLECLRNKRQYRNADAWIHQQRNGHGNLVVRLHVHYRFILIAGEDNNGSSAWHLYWLHAWVRQYLQCFLVAAHENTHAATHVFVERWEREIFTYLIRNLQRLRVLAQRKTFVKIRSKLARIIGHVWYKIEVSFHVRGLMEHENSQLLELFEGPNAE